jgi:hypothetical protein
VAASVTEKLGDLKLALRQSSAKILRKHLEEETWVVKMCETVCKGSLLLKEEYISFCAEQISQQYGKEMITTLCKLV